MPIPRLKSYDGPAILSYGFRPFFLLGSLLSGFSVLLWLPAFYGELHLTTAFAPVDWHIHELYFGFLPAVITGFLFTSVPNWTGRMPLQGTPLLLLVLLWVAGRIAVSFSGFFGWQLAMITDLAFLTSIAAIIAREIIAGKNWRNLKVLVPLVLLLAANLTFHLEAHFNGISDISRRIAIAATIMLIIIIGGRIIPSFTRNWLARGNPGKLPASFGKVDVGAIVISICALALWVIDPESSVTGSAMSLAALAQIFRLGKWVGYRAVREPLVLVLHLSYFFIPVGFALLAAAIFFPGAVSQVAGVHALSVGAIGGMTLSVMVRASLGHTGQKLQVGIAAKLSFTSVFVAAFARVLAAFGFGITDVLLHVAAFGWFIAFAGFGLSFAPALLRPKTA